MITKPADIQHLVNQFQRSLIIEAYNLLLKSSEDLNNVGIFNKNLEIAEDRLVELIWLTYDFASKEELKAFFKERKESNSGRDLMKLLDAMFHSTANQEVKHD
ncbi:MAG TPA: hypothetical protein DD381_11310 [Lentisphaeria bacterium]|nr:MAG: hypothetical protein A2X47_12805 [Lentisphaerae bacterium GWF2_38_69]HBM16917.1 hypothetical protein [Lentisphaeria bacterium]